MVSEFPRTSVEPFLAISTPCQGDHWLQLQVGSPDACIKRTSLSWSPVFAEPFPSESLSTSWLVTGTSEHLPSFPVSIVFPRQLIFPTVPSYFLKVKVGSCGSFPQESSVAPYGIKSGFWQPIQMPPPPTHPLSSLVAVFYVHCCYSNSRELAPSALYFWLSSALLMLFS